MAYPSFKYPSLDKTQSQIRLLEILPQPDSSLRYILTTFDISECPPYVALSYVWGADEPKNTIVINGQGFKIRDNLNFALPHLSSLQDDGNESEFKRSERHFWIDAICINQNDIKERNHQVEMMKTLYTRAALTVAWLGPEDQNLNFFRSLPKKSLRDLTRPRSQEPLEKLACNPYFERMWIIQEVILSRNIWMMSGGGVCAWEDLEHYLRECGCEQILPPYRLHRCALRGGVTKDPFINLLGFMWSRKSHKREWKRLDDLVFLFLDRKCQNPRDRIYALLGLLPPKSLRMNPIPVDYEISLEDLYKLVRKYSHQDKKEWGANGDADRVRSLQVALNIDYAFRLEYDSELIKQGFFYRHRTSKAVRRRARLMLWIFRGLLVILKILQRIIGILRRIVSI